MLPLPESALTRTPTQPARWPQCSDHASEGGRGTRYTACRRTFQGRLARRKANGRVIRMHAVGPLTASQGRRPAIRMSAGGVARLRTGRAREGTPGGGPLASTPRPTQVARRAAPALASGALLICNAQSADQGQGNRDDGSIRLDGTGGHLASSLRSGDVTAARIHPWRARSPTDRVCSRARQRDAPCASNPPLLAAHRASGRGGLPHIAGPRSGPTP